MRRKIFWTLIVVVTGFGFALQNAPGQGRDGASGIDDDFFAIGHEHEISSRAF